MKNKGEILRIFLALAFVLGAAVICWIFVPILIWAELSTKLFTLLSVGTAAVLVRLARTSPFSNPDIFEDESEMERYFSALGTVQIRLSAVLFILIATFFGLALAALSEVKLLGDIPYGHFFWQFVSAINGAFICLLINRTVAIVRGDIGFINLQRTIMIEAMARKKSPPSAPRPAPETKSWRSPNYGRIAGN